MSFANPPVSPALARRSIVLALTLVLLGACHEQEATPTATPAAPVAPAPAVAVTETTPQAVPLEPNPVIDRIVEVRRAIAIGDRAQAEKLMQQMKPWELRAAHVPDPARPIDPDKAAALVKAMAGVESVEWADRANMIVHVPTAKQVNAALIDKVCVAAEALGDNLALIVNVQETAAPSIDTMVTLSRNCGMPPGQRAAILK